MAPVSSLLRISSEKSAVESRKLGVTDGVRAVIPGTQFIG